MHMGSIKERERDAEVGLGVGGGGVCSWVICEHGNCTTFTWAVQHTYA